MGTENIDQIKDVSHAHTSQTISADGDLTAHDINRAPYQTYSIHKDDGGPAEKTSTGKPKFETTTNKADFQKDGGH